MRVMTVERLLAERATEVGPAWAKTRPLGSREPPKRPPKTRAAKPGELEALAVHERLARIIEGRDPFARDALRKALELSTDRVRSYAAALMEGGPTPDPAVAKELQCPVAEVAAARDSLSALLRAIR
jgi:hypothetical protein